MKLLLRKLTEKSILPQGKFEGQKVQTVIDVGQKRYLRYLYFRVQHLSFTDEVLDKIELPKERRIEKPGYLSYDEIDKVEHEMAVEKLDKMDELERLKRLSRGKKYNKNHSKRKVMSSNALVDKISNRKALQYKNHGH